MGARRRSRLPGLEPEMELQKAGSTVVAGVDEVGRGSWAGPLVAAAVILPPGCLSISDLAGIQDSKLLSAKQRIELLHHIREHALGIGIGWATHHVVDGQGLGAANRLAMMRAVRNLPVAVDGLVIDAVRLPECPVRQLAIARGDRLSVSVAAASIVAKVVRDRLMSWYDGRFPEYGFRRHKGYGTLEHRRVLAAIGPCALHRLSFAPVAASVEAASAETGA